MSPPRPSSSGERGTPLVTQVQARSCLHLPDYVSNGLDVPEPDNAPRHDPRGRQASQGPRNLVLEEEDGAVALELGLVDAVLVQVPESGHTGRICLEMLGPCLDACALVIVQVLAVLVMDFSGFTPRVLGSLCASASQTVNTKGVDGCDGIVVRAASRLSTGQSARAMQGGSAAQTAKG